MVNFVSVSCAVILLALLLRFIALPIRWTWKILLNSACGFVCLWILNSVSEFTGIYFPINYVSALIAGFLGLPGILFLLAAQQFL